MQRLGKDEIAELMRLSQFGRARISITIKNGEAFFGGSYETPVSIEPDNWALHDLRNRGLAVMRENANGIRIWEITNAGREWLEKAT